LKLKDDIYLNDVVQTAANSTLGITFSDGTTFKSQGQRADHDRQFVYEDGGKKNAGVFDVAKGTVAFVADRWQNRRHEITTPTATLGIRRTSGLVEVPAGAAAASATMSNFSSIRCRRPVGRIEVNDRAGARLGFLTQGASGFAIRPRRAGARFCAVPLTISPQMIQRDQALCARSTHATVAAASSRSSAPSAAPIRASSIRTGRSASPGNPAGPANCRPGGQPGQNRPSQPPGLQNRPVNSSAGAPGRQGRSSRRRVRRSNPAQRPQPGSTRTGRQPTTGNRASSSKVRSSPACRRGRARGHRPAHPDRSDRNRSDRLPLRPHRRTGGSRTDQSTAAPATAGGQPAPTGAQPLPHRAVSCRARRADCSGRD